MRINNKIKNVRKIENYKLTLTILVAVFVAGIFFSAICEINSFVESKDNLIYYK